jgi:hypothetical protein
MRELMGIFRPWLPLVAGAWLWGGLAYAVEATGEAGAKDVEPWTTRAGQAIHGEFVEYSWVERSLMLRTSPEAEALPVAARDLDLEGKLHLIFAEPFQETVLAHREELESLPTFPSVLERLRALVIVLAGVSIALFLTLSWFFAGVILRKPALRFWLAAVVAFGICFTLAGFGIAAAFARFPQGKALEVTGLLMGAGAVLGLFAVWGIYRSGWWRAILWCLLNVLLIVLVPIAVITTGVAGDVYWHTHALNEAAGDKYLSEVWMVPMGVI